MFIRISLVWFYGLSTIVGYLIPNSFLYIQAVPFQTIQFSISTVFVYTQLNVKTILFQTVQFSISTQFSSIWPTDKTLFGATTSSLSGPGIDGNKRVLCIPQSSIITGASTSDCLVSYSGHSLGRLTPLQRCSLCILQPQLTGP